MFTRLLAGIEQVIGFIIVYWNCDAILKGRCYHGNRFVAHVSENRNVDCCINTIVDSSTSYKNL